MLNINAAKQVQMRTFGWSIVKLLVSAHVQKKEKDASKLKWQLYRGYSNTL